MWAVVHIHNGVLLNHQKERKFAVCNNMDGLEGSENERQSDSTYVWNIKNKTNWYVITLNKTGKNQ